MLGWLHRMALQILALACDFLVGLKEFVSKYVGMRRMDHGCLTPPLYSTGPCVGAEWANRSCMARPRRVPPLCHRGD